MCRELKLSNFSVNESWILDTLWQDFVYNVEDLSSPTADTITFSTERKPISALCSDSRGSACAFLEAGAVRRTCAKLIVYGY